MKRLQTWMNATIDGELLTKTQVQQRFPKANITKVEVVRDDKYTLVTVRVLVNVPADCPHASPSRAFEWLGVREKDIAARAGIPGAEFPDQISVRWA